MHDFLDYLFKYGLFVAETVTLVVAILFVFGSLAHLRKQLKEQNEDNLEIRSLNDRFEYLADSLRAAMLDADEYKAHHKQVKKQKKKEAKAAKHGAQKRRAKVFVLDFHGDIAASAVEPLRVEISALLQVAKEGDTVLLRLESAGGVVHGYGLAASQLRRLRERNIHLTAAVDKVAASGGYMMACVADRIIAAPFAIIGSIGVVGQLPNFNRLLQAGKVDYEMHTAGEYKRTLTMLGENTEAGREKFRAELEETHVLFKDFVHDNRPAADIAMVATGEHWFGQRAKELQLVDALQTSDDWLLAAASDHDLYELHYKPRRSLRDRVAGGLGQAVAKLTGRTSGADIESRTLFKAQ